MLIFIRWNSRKPSYVCELLPNTERRIHKNRIHLTIMSKFCFLVSKSISKKMHIKSFVSDCNWTRTHNYLVHKRTLNHLAKLIKWLSCVVSTYLYGVVECMVLSCHVHVSEWTTFYSCLKRVRDMIRTYSQQVFCFNVKYCLANLQ